MKSLHILCLAAALCPFAIPGPLAGQTTAQRAELAKVRYELSKFQEKVRDAGGTPFEINDYDKKALSMVQDLAKSFPADPAVLELVESAKTAYRAAKGARFEVTPAMLAHRQRGADLAKLVADAAEARWKVRVQEHQNDPSRIEAFPSKPPLDTDPAELDGKTVLLPDVPYEKSLFVQGGQNWLAVGSAKDGYYWIDASGTTFDRLYAALQRFRGAVKQSTEPNWTFIARVKGPDLLAPETGTTAAFGWTVEPLAFLIPGVVMVELDDKSPGGAGFAGEEAMKKALNFSITSVPESVTPEDLVRIYVTALKEKNWDLHLACLDPELQRDPAQLNGLRYNWEVQQKGLERIHAHAEPDPAGKIETIAGGEDANLESFFGDPVKTLAPAKPKEERVKLLVRLYDENGVQTVRPRRVTLVRRASGRWYIYSGATLAF
jgi:hypothetical protein